MGNSTQILEDFIQSDDQVYTFAPNMSNYERAAIHKMCRTMGLKSKSQGKGDQRCLSIYKSLKKVKAKNNGKEKLKDESCRSTCKNLKKCKDKKKVKEKLKVFKFSEDAKVALEDLFTQYPPGDRRLENFVRNQSRRTDRARIQKDNIFGYLPLSKVEIANKRKDIASRIKKSANLREITQTRTKLPIASFKDVITSTIESNQVVLISGETGCGKTTQVPQFLLDHLWDKGEACKIICTQPRRISAISVAERIAVERGEKIGGDIGYKIRLESKGGKHTSIVFCTNGIMLRILVSTGRSTRERDTIADEGISNITHIIVDEIHERDRYSDFMLAIIRDILPSYPHLRLILMSATLDAERFSQYFGGCPIIRVPGFTFPVKAFYMDDILSILHSDKNNHHDSAVLNVLKEKNELTAEDKATVDEAIDLAWSNDEFDPLLDLVFSEVAPQIYNYQHSLTGFTPLMVFAGKGRTSDVFMLLSHGVDCLLKAKDGSTALELAERENQEEISDVIRKHMNSAQSDFLVPQQLVKKYLATVDPGVIDVVLIEKLVYKVCADSRDGAILVFLPGWEDIKRTRDRLFKNPFFNDASKFVIIPFHSMVPSAEQKRVFKRPPVGCRKIILATNIAETAITIDDVVYVIDSGRMKEKGYDPYENVSTLQSSWVSKASAKQREGRAGRCQPGICYHLFSKERAASMIDFQVPELQRMPIEELCLQVKLLDPDCKIELFLGKTMDPPRSDTIENAIVLLQNIGALTNEETLTELGKQLAILPLHPLISKMLFFAILMNCLDPALTLACASDFRDPFIIPILPNDKKKANDARCELASLYGGQSDQFGILAAFEFWKRAKEMGKEKYFCSTYFISSATMSMLNDMRSQLQKELIRNGFIPDNVSECSLNAHDPGILHAVLVSGLYPMVGKLLPLKNGVRSIETTSGAKVRLHPRSSNFKLKIGKKSDDCPLMMYAEITRGDAGVYIKNCTVVGTLPLLLLAKEIAVVATKDSHKNLKNEKNNKINDASNDDADGDEYEMGMNDMLPGKGEEKIMSSPENPVIAVVDRCLSFESTALDVAQIYCLRERISAAILFKVTHPHELLPPILGLSIYTVACVLSYHGPSETAFLVESVKSPSSSLHDTETNKSTEEKNKGLNKLGPLLKSLMNHDKNRKPAQNYINRVFFS